MPAPESTTMTPSMTTMLTALSADAGATVIDLSESAELGRSTASRILAALEGRGLARRERAERTGEHRAPDLWFAAAPATAESEKAEPDEATPDDKSETAGQQATESPAGAEDPEPRSEEQVESEDTPTDADADFEHAAQPGSDAVLKDTESSHEPESGDGPVPEPATDPDPVTDEEAPSESGSENESRSNAPDHAAREGAADGQTREHDPMGPAEPGPAADPETSAAAPSEGGASRLAKGGLRAMVLGHLTAHPDDEFTASKLGKILARSSGAISNALDTLIKHGQAEMTYEKPRTFRYLE